MYTNSNYPSSSSSQRVETYFDNRKELSTSLDSINEKTINSKDVSVETIGVNQHQSRPAETIFIQNHSGSEPQNKNNSIHPFTRNFFDCFIISLLKIQPAELSLLSHPIIATTVDYSNMLATYIPFWTDRFASTRLNSPNNDTEAPHFNKSNKPKWSFSNIFPNETLRKLQKLSLIILFVSTGCPTLTLAFVLDSYINQQIHNKQHHQISGKKRSIPRSVSSTRFPSGKSKTALHGHRKPIQNFSPNQHHYHHLDSPIKYSLFNSLISYLILAILSLVIFYWFWLKNTPKQRGKYSQSLKNPYYSKSKKANKKISPRNKNPQDEKNSLNLESSDSSFQSETENLSTPFFHTILRRLFSVFSYIFPVFLFGMFIDTAKFYFMVITDTFLGIFDLFFSSAQQAFRSLAIFNLFSRSSSEIDDKDLIDLNAESFEDDDDEMDSTDENESETQQDTITPTNSHNLDSKNWEKTTDAGTTLLGAKSRQNIVSEDGGFPLSLTRTLSLPESPAISVASDIGATAEGKKLKKQRKQAYEKQLKASKMGGIFNEGNTCFMNSIVQSLASLDSIDVLLDKIVDRADKSISSDREYIPRASIALRQLIHKINIKRACKHTHSAGGLVRSMGKNASRWLSSDQEDAQEYFQQVLDVLDKDTKALLIHDSDSQQEDDAQKSSKEPKIVTPFDGQTHVRVGCLKCGETEGLRPETASSVNLSLESTTSDTDLNFLLQEYTTLEVISDVECYRCSLVNVENQLNTLIEKQLDDEGNPSSEVSKKTIELLNTRLNGIREILQKKVIDEKAYSSFNVNAKKELVDKSKQVMFSRPTARILPIHINRSVFDFRTGYVRKNSANVAFPEVLDLSPYVIADPKDRRNLDPKVPMISVTESNAEHITEKGNGVFEGDTDGEIIKTNDVSEDHTESPKPEEPAETADVNGSNENIDGKADDKEFDETVIQKAANGSARKRVRKLKKTKPKHHIPSPDSLIYNLKSVVVHYGSHNFGHYICYRKCRHNLWWEISDHVVNQVSLDKVLDAQGAFMLFYEQEYESKARKERLKQLKLCVEAESKSKEDDGENAKECQDSELDLTKQEGADKEVHVLGNGSSKRDGEREENIQGGQQENVDKHGNEVSSEPTGAATGIDGPSLTRRRVM